jgi:hypothetical protein
MNPLNALPCRVLMASVALWPIPALAGEAQGARDLFEQPFK